MLADSSNAYVVDFKIYAGRAEGGISQYGLGYDVVRKPMLDYEGQGYHLFFLYNFYSSVTLARHLYERGILYTGTIIETRGLCGWRVTPPVLASQWLDNKVVSMISTSANANAKVQATRKTRVAGVWDPHRRVDQPQVFQDYNRFMNAVDRSDQILATHSVHRKSMRWWKAVFFDGIETAVVNSFIIFKEYQARFPGDERLQRPPSYNLRDFRVELARNIASLPKFGSPPLYSRVGRPQAPRGDFEVEHCPIYVDEKRDSWCVRRGMGLGGKFTPCAVLLSVRGSTCISPRR